MVSFNEKMNECADVCSCLFGRMTTDIYRIEKSNVFAQYDQNFRSWMVFLMHPVDCY